MEKLNVPPENHVKVLGGQGWVGLIDHLGSETTLVNAARVSFGKIKKEMDERDVKLIEYLLFCHRVKGSCWLIKDHN